MDGLEMWGGVECTVNRVGDQFSDQVRLSGHHDRIGDLELISDLGLRTLRYPLVWERVEIEPGRFDWSWTDERMAALRRLGIRPIAGLVHHGSGPRWTNLLDDGFASGLARFAREAAQRYPWIRDWTPVNEPLTTARFSAMYGHWYPHRRSEDEFWVAFLNQIDAVRLSMDEIRAVIPDARLIQTEDFGITFGTTPCGDQVRHENIRRLATWDLLAGRVGEGHPLRRHIAGFGLGGRLAAIQQRPCPADVIGLNHYATSDRFLDHRVDLYPPHMRGGNGHSAYVDTEAVRVRHDGRAGWAELMRRLWNRYQAPIAVTECHLGCSPDEQIRWLADCWEAAVDARNDGIPVMAVTAWALLGSFDWDSLLTRQEGRYESGAFDLASGSEPRITPLGGAIRQLASVGRIDPDGLHAKIAEQGWWVRSDRFSPWSTAVM